MKTDNQDMIQQLMDEGEYAPSYPFVMQSKLSDFQKLLITQMLNDIRMNGSITWKHDTYASKLGKSRKGILGQFKVLTELEILVPHKDNKVGGKNNKFSISFTNIEEFGHVTRESKPVTQENKPVTRENKPVTLETSHVTRESKPVTGPVHIKKVKETNKEQKEIIKKVNTGGDTIFNDILKGGVEPKTEEEINLTEFLNSLDLEH